MSFKYLVLGCLLDFPTHGYSLMKKILSEFAPANSPVNEGRLYSTIKKLEKEQLIKRRIMKQDNLPDQKIISITPKGEEDFYHWLTSDSLERDTTKFDFFQQYPFLVKVNNFKYLDNAHIQEKLKEQLQVCMCRIERFNQAHKNMITHDVNKYRISIVEYGLEVERVRIKWLRNLLTELERGNVYNGSQNSGN